MALMGVTGSSRSELRQRREHRRGGITAMIMGMGTLRITEAELARDIHAVLAKVQEGAEIRSEEHTSELQSLRHLVCRLPLEKKKTSAININPPPAYFTRLFHLRTPPFF